MSKYLLLAVVGAAFASSGCGYHVVGSTNNLPSTLHSISVPTFKNETARFKVEQQVTSAVVREFMTRTKYDVRANESPGDADAILRGTITGFAAYPVVLDPKNTRATTSLVNVRVKVTLVDRRTGKVLYEKGDFDF